MRKSEPWIGNRFSTPSAAGDSRRSFSARTESSSMFCVTCSGPDTADGNMRDFTSGLYISARARCAAFGFDFRDLGVALDRVAAEDDFDKSHVTLR